MDTSHNYFNTSFMSLKNYEDPRTKNWLLMSTPFPTALFCLLYLFFVNFLGPKIMENRKPLELRRTIIGYNLLQVALSSWLFYEFCASGWLTGEYSFRCQPIDRSNSPQTMRMVKATWWFFFSKFTELAETVFFILRKRFRQVNILHVYHHGVMLLSGWLATRYYPSGHGTFPGLVNSFVHMIMYTYYLLSAFGPAIHKYLWWKKYLTTMQMVQFVVIIVHALQVLAFNCNFPRIFMWYMTFLAVSFYFLFKNFYKRTYTERKNKK